MLHTLFFNSETKTIEAKMIGDLTFCGTKELITQLAQMAKENNCNLLLNDFNEAIIKLSTFEIYELPKIMLDTFTSVGLNVRLMKRALIVKKDLQDYTFYETVTKNSGQNAKIFNDIDEAKEWLYNK